MQYHYRDSNFTIAIIAKSILSLSTNYWNDVISLDLPYGEKFLRDKIFADFTVGLTSAKIKFANFYKSTQ